MEKGGERCALTAGGEVGGTEVRNDGNAETLGDPGGFADLPGGGGAAGLVEDCLTMEPDGIDGFVVQAAGAQWAVSAAGAAICARVAIPRITGVAAAASAQSVAQGSAASARPT